MKSNYEWKQLLSNNFFSNNYPNPNNAFLAIQFFAAAKKIITPAIKDMKRIIFLNRNRLILNRAMTIRQWAKIFLKLFFCALVEEIIVLVLSYKIKSTKIWDYWRAKNNWANPWILGLNVFYSWKHDAMCHKISAKNGVDQLTAMELIWLHRWSAQRAIGIALSQPPFKASFVKNMLKMGQNNG